MHCHRNSKDDEGNWAAAAGKGKIGPADGAGAFVGYQAQINLTNTYNSEANVFRGKWVTLPNGHTWPY